MKTAGAGTESLSDTMSLGIRFFYYANTIDMIKEKPFFGRGPGTFKVHYPMYRDKRTAFHLGETSMEYRVEHPHTMNISKS